MNGFTLPSYPATLPDIEQELLYIQEYAESHYPGLPYYRLLTTRPELDDVHMEIGVTQRRYAEPVVLHGLVRQASTPEEPTTRFGIDWTRSITVFVPVLTLKDAGLATLDGNFDLVSLSLGMGDKLEYHGKFFEVVSGLKRDPRLWMTDIPGYIMVDAKPFREDSSGFVDVDTH